MGDGIARAFAAAGPFRGVCRDGVVLRPGWGGCRVCLRTGLRGRAGAWGRVQDTRRRSTWSLSSGSSRDCLYGSFIVRRGALLQAERGLSPPLEGLEAPGALLTSSQRPSARPFPRLVALRSRADLMDTVIRRECRLGRRVFPRLSFALRRPSMRCLGQLWTRVAMAGAGQAGGG